ncbi:hypothetical protein ACQPZP_42480 [Spirillospora sp. CA-142024]|uniref:hypothetical protein n=1 Tax=Spirillospora sp. CA-142024 TaxID=3240036 RepID=UPI003D8C4F6F
MMSFARRPIDLARLAPGVVSIALAGGVIATACSIIVDDGGSITDSGEFVVKYVVVLLGCAVVGAIISAVLGVIVRAVFGHTYGFDLAVAVGIVVVGAGIGGLIGSAHDSGLVYDGGIVYGGLVGVLAGAFVAFGGFAGGFRRGL